MEFLKTKLKKENIMTILGVVLILAAIILLSWESIGQVFNKSSDPKDIAVQIAYKEFKKLGEKGLEKETFKVININNNGEESFYISSQENSIQIRKSDYKVILLNTVKTAD
jgi:hypothetical protein